MTPSELLFKLKNLPSDTPITMEHIIAILGSLQAPQTVAGNPGAYSSWDNDKMIDTDTLAEWIGETSINLRKWRLDGRGPKYISKPRHISYRVGDVRDWLKSRTVQSTTQADTLSFVAASDCYIRPTVLHDMKPVPLFESIETFDDETNFTGVELLAATNDSLAALYLSAVDESNPERLLSDTETLNQSTKLFRNGDEWECTLAHLLARYPFSDESVQMNVLSYLLDRGLDCHKADDKMQDAVSYGNLQFIDTVSKYEMMKKLGEMLSPPKKSRVID